MTENRFDKEIKEALKDHQMDLPSSDWSTMNDKLNEAFGFQDDPMLEKEFDNSISNKMNSDLSEYNHAHWDLLLKRLEKEEEKHFHTTVRKILRYVALLLLFVSIYNWQGNNLFESEPKETHYASTSADPTGQENPKSNAEASTLNVSESKEIQKTNSQTTHRNRNNFNSSNTATAITQAPVQQIAAYLNNAIPTKKPIVLASSVITHEVTELKADIYAPHNSSLSANADLQKPVATAIDAINESPRLALLSIDELKSERIQSNKMPTLDFQNESKKFSLSLGVMASPDLYLIRSPEDPIYPLPSYYTGSSGLSGGITFSAEKNNVELLTGLSYSSVSYQPRDYVEVYSSRGKFYQTSLNSIFFNSISIPVNFNIYFDLTNNSRIYTTFGTTFNTIINSNFDIVENQIPQPTGVPSSRTRNSLLNSKDFEEGIFEGGSLFDNTYFTGDIGIGYLREFKSNWSFYVQPTLHTQYTEGIGPNQDYLHKLSIYAGLKYSL